METKSIEVNSVQLKASADDLQLAVIYTLPQTKPTGVLQLVHGMCEHKERYLPFMQFMSENGWICVLHDHRGHGASIKSPEDLGYFYDGGYQAMINDVEVVTGWIRNTFPGIKISMLGHSMGSMVVRSFLKEHDQELEKLIVCGSPSYDPASKMGILLTKFFIKKNGAKSRPALIQKISFNSFNKNFQKEGSPNAWVCSNKQIVEAYDKDPLCTYQFTANGFQNLFLLMQHAYGKEGWKLAKPSLPIHFISGADDPCLTNHKKFAQAVQFLKKVGYQQVTSHLYPNMRHEILNETDKALVWNDVLNFLNQ